MQWKPIVALALIYAAVLLEWSWVWGAFFLLYLYPTVVSRQTFLVEDVSRDKSPVLFWLIVGTWLVFGAVSVGTDVAPWIMRETP